MTNLAISRTPSAHDARLSIGQILSYGVAKAPAQEIVYADRVRHTYATLDERVCRLASALSGLGVEPGSTVAVMDWDSHRYLVHVGSRPAALIREDVAAFGDLDAYTTVDLSAGIKRNNWTFDFFIKNAFNEEPELTRFAQCATDTCGFQPYTVHGAPRSFGIRFSQEF